ncbi:hypothetical protein B9479_005907 [Cryptococcus floricola]|uniref:Uncharacterized protein n=1 Tax=Cryptococcus floricola TaxID=2591691 RepID=A0A5D3ATG6_9TREE|nr:hypothetical protein B9479_005907 [Cryptococcus floricola]
MPGSKYESIASYHIGGTSASSTYNDDGSVAIAVFERPSQLDETTTTGASQMTRSEYIAQHSKSREESLLQKELDKYPRSTWKPDRSALSSKIPMEMLLKAPRWAAAKAKTEDAKAAREELVSKGWTVVATDNEAEDGYTKFLYVDTPFIIK